MRENDFFDSKLSIEVVFIWDHYLQFVTTIWFLIQEWFKQKYKWQQEIINFIQWISNSDVAIVLWQKEIIVLFNGIQISIFCACGDEKKL